MDHFDDIFEVTPPDGKKPFDKAAWGERKQAERQAVYELADQTAMTVAGSPEMFRAYLDTQSRFHRYTATNALLILAQMPSATRVKDFDGWKESGVSIKKHQKSFSILEPGNEYDREDGTRGTSYNVKKVFDISQTTARADKPRPAPDQRTILQALIHQPPVPITAVDTLPDNLGALYNPEAQAIHVRRNMTAPDIFRSVSMELAHAELGVSDQNYSRGGAGMTAYCVSYLLCRQYGIDASGYDFSRIPDSFRDATPHSVRAELTKIRDTAEDISRRMSRFLDQNKTPRAKGQER